jgi:predicted MPP superfamily phosphohydrolase/hypoxanthine-guanine phosphoribosyltransferase
MNKLRLLHLTDLHIDNPNYIGENLRKGFYIQFLKGLTNCINEAIEYNNIDYIITTGDYINKGNSAFENSTNEKSQRHSKNFFIKNKFEHSKEVINYISSNLNVANNRISTCIGNHDYLIEKEDEPEGRKDYKNIIESNFSFGKLLFENVFFRIYFQANNELYLISFDSTYSSNKSGKPGKLTNEEIDTVRSCINKYIPEDKILLVQSHYPMIIFPDSNLHLDEKGWVENHLWKSGNKIAECLNILRKDKPTIYFFGDSHIPDFRNDNTHSYIMTGMLGGDYTKRGFNNENNDIISFNKTNEAKLIEIELKSYEIRIYTFRYEPRGFNFDPQTGLWQSNSSLIRPVSKSPFKIQNKLEETPKVESENLEGIFNSIGGSVEDEIISEIINRKLYQFNRFLTNQNQTSIGWVQIHKLFQNKQLMSRCFDKSLSEIKGWLKHEFNSEETVFIGIDFWGAMFASYIGVRENITNYCFATKYEGKHNHSFESIDYVKSKIKTRNNTKNIILFTDVVATGNTILGVLKRINEHCENSNFKWSVISILAERTQKNRIDLKEFVNKGTLCSRLIIPILDNSELPDLSIVPAKYDLR